MRTVEIIYQVSWRLLLGFAIGVFIVQHQRLMQYRERINHYESVIQWQEDIPTEPMGKVILL